MPAPFEIAAANRLVELQRFAGKGVRESPIPSPAPRAIPSKATSSSPANSTKRSPKALMRSVNRRGSGADSLIATMLGTLRQRRASDVDIHPIGRGVVVQHDGQAGRRRHRSKMIFELSRRRHVDHGGQHHEPGRTEALGIADEIHRRSGREFRDTHDDRHLAFGDLRPHR